MLEINVEETWTALLAREDTDNNVQITIEDMGPKVASTCHQALSYAYNYSTSILVLQARLV